MPCSKPLLIVLINPWLAAMDGSVPASLVNLVDYTPQSITLHVYTVLGQALLSGTFAAALFPNSWALLTGVFSFLRQGAGNRFFLKTGLFNKPTRTPRRFWARPIICSFFFKTFKKYVCEVKFELSNSWFTSTYCNQLAIGKARLLCLVAFFFIPVVHLLCLVFFYFLVWFDMFSLVLYFLFLFYFFFSFSFSGILKLFKKNCEVFKFVSTLSSHEHFLKFMNFFQICEFFSNEIIFVNSANYFQSHDFFAKFVSFT